MQARFVFSPRRPPGAVLSSRERPGVEAELPALVDTLVPLVVDLEVAADDGARDGARRRAYDLLCRVVVATRRQQHRDCVLRPYPRLRPADGDADRAVRFVHVLPTGWVSRDSAGDRSADPHARHHRHTGHERKSAHATDVADGWAVVSVQEVLHELPHLLDFIPERLFSLETFIGEARLRDPSREEFLLQLEEVLQTGAVRRVDAASPCLEHLGLGFGLADLSLCQCPAALSVRLRVLVRVAFADVVLDRLPLDASEFAETVPAEGTCVHRAIVVHVSRDAPGGQRSHQEETEQQLDRLHGRPPSSRIVVEMTDEKAKKPNEK